MNFFFHEIYCLEDRGRGFPNFRDQNRGARNSGELFDKILGYPIIIEEVAQFYLMLSPLIGLIFPHLCYRVNPKLLSRRFSWFSRAPI